MPIFYLIASDNIIFLYSMLFMKTVVLTHADEGWRSYPSQPIVPI